MAPPPDADSLQHGAVLSHHGLANHRASVRQLHRAALRLLEAGNRLLEQLARLVALALEVGLEVCEGRFGEKSGV